jgi:hypothetical protein
MESYRIVLRTGTEEDLGPAELVEDEESFTFRLPDGSRTFRKHDVEIIEEETPARVADGRAA